MPPQAKGRDPDDYIVVPPRQEDEFRFAFKFRAGPGAIPVVTSYAVFEVDAQPCSASTVKSRLPRGTFDWARSEAAKILTRERDFSADTDMDPVPEALLESLPSGADVTEDAAGLIISQKPPEKDDLHYARYVIPWVQARREGKAATAAYKAVQLALAPALSTVKGDVAEARRRELDKATDELLDAGEEPTPAAVVRRSRGNKLVYPSPEAEGLLRQRGIEMPEGGRAGWEAPNRSGTSAPGTGSDPV